jgi:hypothetical protein
MYDDAENAFRWVHLGNFSKLENSWNTAILIILSEPIIDDNLEVDIPEIFPILKKIPMTVYLKPSGPTIFFKIPT